jgi:uncharacterized damage-inducible protein DinB
MPLLTPQRARTSLTYLHPVLRALTANLTNEEAHTRRDGPDGWSVVEIVCHMADFHGIFQGRAERVLHEDNPTIAVVDHEARVSSEHYAGYTLEEALAWHARAVEAFSAFLEPLTPERFARPGLHPESGPLDLLQLVYNAVHHDLNHLQQITKTR